MKQPIRVTVWNEFHDERKHTVITDLYPGGVHEYIAAFLKEEADLEVSAHHFYEDDLFDLSDVRRARRLPGSR
ncbi:hypothetical protein LJC63_09195 [Ruminococcaceae bacterium OttesenSCG-928-L11]|nr:hypothetical protein [Ruminococcaceae bacterium OttesenSCG-928-L11]